MMLIQTMKMKFETLYLVIDMLNYQYLSRKSVIQSEYRNISQPSPRDIKPISLKKCLKRIVIHGDPNVCELENLEGEPIISKFYGEGLYIPSRENIEEKYGFG